MDELHLAALIPAAVAAACAGHRPAGPGRAVSIATGVLMVLAMTDLAGVPGVLPALAWAALLLVAGMAAAVAGRDVAESCRPLHVLHVGCLAVMAALTAATAGARGGATGSGSHGAHTGGIGVLTGLALAGATVLVVAGLTIAARRRVPGDGLARVEALAGAGAVGLMALATV